MLNTLLTRALRHAQFPGRISLLDHACPTEGKIVADVFGYHLKLDLSDRAQRQVYCNTYKPDQLALLSPYIRRGMTFVDVGANIGYFTLLFASFEQEHIGDGTFDQDYLGNPGRVYAFEPGPYASGRLQETLAYNELLNVHMQAVALGDTSGEQPIYVSRQPGNHRRSMLPYPDSVPVKVPVKRLDDFLREEGVREVDLLRIDVNGYEPNVLAGAAQTLKDGRVAAILCAFDAFWLEQNGSSRAALYELLAAYGYGSPMAKAALERGAKSLLLTL